MAKILLFGSNSIKNIPAEVTDWLIEYNNQNHEFILRANECGKAFTKELSAIGVPKEKVAVYSMNTIYSRDFFNFPIKQFITEYDEKTKEVTINELENKEYPNVNYPKSEINNDEFKIYNIEKQMDIPYNKSWLEFRDNRLIKDCAMAICLWDSVGKTESRMIQKLNIHNKPCYTFTLA